MNLENFIKDVVDFPKPGIIFKDISPLLANPEAFNSAVDAMAKNISECDVIVGLDARWFLFAWALSYALEKTLVLVRKKWKLPDESISIDYDLEYGSNSFEIHKNAIKSWDKVAVIDDLLATGWTALAACELIEKLGWEISSIEFIVELEFLHWKEKLNKYTINSLLKY